MKTKIRLLLNGHSDQDPCLPFHVHLTDTLLHWKMQTKKMKKKNNSNFRTSTIIIFCVPIFRIFTVVRHFREKESA